MSVCLGAYLTLELFYGESKVFRQISQFKSLISLDQRWCNYATKIFLLVKGWRNFATEILVLDNGCLLSTLSTVTVVRTAIHIKAGYVDSPLSLPIFLTL